MCFHSDICHMLLGLAWVLISLISLYRNPKTVFHMQFNFSTVLAVCFWGYDDAWSCECGIKNSVFQGHTFWSRISPPRSYSQQHSSSPWKGILGCIAERFEYLRSKTLIISKTCRTGGCAEVGCGECEEPSARRQNDSRRKALSVILGLQMEPPQ